MSMILYRQGLELPTGSNDEWRDAYEQAAACGDVMSLAYGTWNALRTLGLLYGWEPELADADVEFAKAYEVDSGTLLSASDAAGLGAAIEVADAVRGRAPDLAPASQREPVQWLPADPPAEIAAASEPVLDALDEQFRPDEENLLPDFARFCRGGAFTLG